MKKILLLSLSITILLGCGTKKKALEKEKVKTELSVETETTKEEVQVTEEKTNQVKTVDSTAEKNEITIKNTKDKEFDIEADEGGEVTVIEEKTATGTKTTYTGVKNVSVRDKVTNETKSLKWRITLLKADSISSVRKDSIAKSEYTKQLLLLEQEIKTINSTKEKKIGSILLCILPWAIILILIIIWYIRRRAKRLTG